MNSSPWNALVVALGALLAGSCLDERSSQLPTAPIIAPIPIPPDLSPNEVVGCWRSDRGCKMVCFDRTGGYNAVATDSIGTFEDSGTYAITGYRVTTQFERRSSGGTSSGTDSFAIRASDTLLTLLGPDRSATGETLRAIFPDSFPCAKAWVRFQRPKGWDTLIEPSGVSNTSIVPPAITMLFPQPDEMVSQTTIKLDAYISTLAYPGMRFGPKTGYLLAPGTGSKTSHETSGFISLPDTVRLINGRIHLVLPLDSSFGDHPLDGAFHLTFRVETYQGTYLPRRSILSYRTVPFYLDRSAPILKPSVYPKWGPNGDTAILAFAWTDTQTVLTPFLSLARFQVRNNRDSIVYEPQAGIWLAGGFGIHWGTRGVPDGLYSFRIDACDPAVPDAQARTSELNLKGAISQGSNSMQGRWSDSLSKAWDNFRQIPGFNWGTATVKFRLDRTAPTLAVEPIRTPVSSKDLFRLRFKMADVGSTTTADTVRIGMTFLPSDSGGFYNVVQKLDTSFTALPESLGASPLYTMGEFDGGYGRLPDGLWKVVLHWKDGLGNSDSLSIPGTLTVDRTPPIITSFLLDHFVVKADAVPKGGANLVARDAAVAGVAWLAPDGTRTEAMMTIGTDAKTWTSPYPLNLGTQRGTWYSVVSVQDSAGNLRNDTETITVQ